MLSLFPQLLDFSIMAVVALRIATALLFIWDGCQAFKKRKRWHDTSISLVGIIAGVLLFVGLFTQAAAVILALVTVFQACRENKGKNWRTWDLRYYSLLFIVSLSFLFLGPGIWGIDYPL